LVVFSQKESFAAVTVVAAAGTYPKSLTSQRES
jgi:hypothetical protein